MIAIVGTITPSNQSDVAPALQVVARAGGWTESTAKQLLTPSDPRCPFTRGAVILSALISAGHSRLAFHLKQSIDRAVAVPASKVTEEDFCRALEAERRADGEADVAALFIRDRSSYVTWRRRAIHYRDLLDVAIRTGDAYWAVA